MSFTVKIDPDEFGRWKETAAVEYAPQTRNGNRLVLKAWLNGDITVTHGIETLYRGRSIGVAKLRFEKA